MKDLLAQVALFTLILLSPHANAQEKPLWISEAPGSPYFSETYHLKGKDCFVNVHADGKGVTLLARIRTVEIPSPSNLDSVGTIVVQQVDIRREGKFKTKTDRRSASALVRVSIPESGETIIIQTSFLEHDEAPAAFLTCQEEAKELPEKVKTLFLGEYGPGESLPLKPE